MKRWQKIGVIGVVAKVVIGLIVLAVLMGCAMVPPKQYVEVLPKTKFVVVGDVKTFKNTKEGIKGLRHYIENIGEETNDLSYIELAETYSAVLKEKLKESGFVVLEKHENLEASVLVISTKLGYMPPILLVRYAAIKVQIEVIHNGRLVLSFDKSALVSSWGALVLSEALPVDSAKTQVRKFIVPLVVKEIKEHFL